MPHSAQKGQHRDDERVDPPAASSRLVSSDAGGQLREQGIKIVRDPPLGHPVTPRRGVHRLGPTPARQV
jgi:hypothetical protein